MEACFRITLAQSTQDSQVLRSMLVTTGPAPLTPCPHHPDADSALAQLRRTALDNWRAPACAVEEVLSATWPAMAVPAAGYWNGLSAATYERLLDLGDPQVTAQVAGNLGAPAYLIRRLYEAEQGRWRVHVLSNAPSIPIDLMVDQALAGRSGGGQFHWDVEGVMALANHPDAGSAWCPSTTFADSPGWSPP